MTNEPSDAAVEAARKFISEWACGCCPECEKSACEHMESYLAEAITTHTEAAVKAVRETVSPAMREAHAVVNALTARLAAAEAERDQAYADYQDLGRVWHEDCLRLEAELRSVKSQHALDYCQYHNEVVQAEQNTRLVEHERDALKAALEKIQTIYKTRQIDKEVMEITHTVLRAIAPPWPPAESQE